MELFLNLTWVALAMVLACLCLRSQHRAGHERRAQVVALAVLIAILLPVISVSDDLLAIQNATEVDTCLRRNSMAQLHAHPLLPVMGVVPAAFSGYPGRQAWSPVAPARPSFLSAEHPELAGIENRPPPAA